MSKAKNRVLKSKIRLGVGQKFQTSSKYTGFFYFLSKRRKPVPKEIRQEKH